MPLQNELAEERLNSLEAEARKLQVSPERRTEWLKATNAYAGRFLDQLPESRMYGEAKAEEINLTAFPFTEEGISIQEALDLYRRHVEEPGLNPASGNMFGYIPGGGLLPSAMGDFIAAVTNRYSGVFFASPGSVRMENMLIRWMCGLVGYPSSSLGNLTSGGSIASLVAIATARDFMQIKAAQVEKSVIYLTGQVHHSIQKALRIAGLREAVIRDVPMDSGFRMDPKALEAQVKEDIATGLKPFLVVSSAGTTDTGAVDPMERIADIAEAHEMWHHVDAAYGGFFLLTEEAKALFKGIERSDSVTIDPHKGMFLPYGTGAVLIKNIAALSDTHHYLASYMQDTLSATEELSPADLGPELTKHFRGLRMWLPMKLYGLGPFRAALSEKLWLCRYFYEKVRELGFETGPEPDLSVAIYRYVPASGDANAFNARLVEEIRKDGRVFLSSTTINGIFWIRLAVLCFRSHKENVDLVLDVITDIKQRLI